MRQARARASFSLRAIFPSLRELRDHKTKIPSPFWFGHHGVADEQVACARPISAGKGLHPRPEHTGQVRGPSPDPPDCETRSLPAQSGRSRGKNSVLPPSHAALRNESPPRPEAHAHVGFRLAVSGPHIRCPQRTGNSGRVGQRATRQAFSSYRPQPCRGWRGRTRSSHRGTPSRRKSAPR